MKPPFRQALHDQSRTKMGFYSLKTLKIFTQSCKLFLAKSGALSQLIA
jgi:hypothetical protein